MIIQVPSDTSKYDRKSLGGECMSKRMAIFTVSIGQGHHQVSKALQEEWEGRGFDAEIIDIFSKMEKPWADKLKQLYFYSIYRAPRLWDWTYQITNLKLASALASPFLQWCGKGLVSYCNQQKFDYIVTTHPMATQIGRVIKKKTRHPCKLFAVLTDFSTHFFSISKNIDGIFVAEVAERRQLEKQEPGCSFYSYGIPLRKTWDSLQNKEFYRRKLGLPLYDKIIVIAGGGEGVYRHEQIMTVLERENIPLHVYWFLGKEQEEQDSNQLPNGTVIRFLPFSDSYSDYVKGADLFLSKPGGVSMAEALKWQIPTGILPPLPGQEKINQLVLKKYPHVKVLDSSCSLVNVMEELNLASRTLQETEERGCARERIIDCILDHKGKNQLERGQKEESFFGRLLKKPSFSSSTRNT